MKSVLGPPATMPAQQNFYMNINAANAISHANPKTPTITRTARLFAIAETNSGKNGNAAVKTNIYFASTLGKAIAIHAKQNSE